MPRKKTSTSSKKRLPVGPGIITALLCVVILLVVIPLGIRWFGKVDYHADGSAGNSAFTTGSSAGPAASIDMSTTLPSVLTTASVTTAGKTTGTNGTTAATKKPDVSRHYVQPAGAPWNLLLVNAWNKMPDNYESTINIVNYASGKQFDSRAVDALRQMIKAGSQYNLSAASLYRSVELQTTLYNRKVNSYLSQGYQQKEAEAKAATVVARPGTSEHNTGLAVDILGSGYSSLEQSFENTPAFKWLKEHCAEFGFILRFPKEWEDVTGVIYEPWHYRYVGVEHAKKIMSRGITLEQYLEESGM